MQSNNNTVISLPSQTIVAADGVVWSIVNGQVAANGIVDPTTGGVIEMAYEGGTVWQKDAGNLWRGKAAPAAAWAPPSGTASDPVPGQVASPNNTVLAVNASGSAGVITDASGNAWSVLDGRVTLNGLVDPTTADVTEMAYVNGRIWQESGAGQWSSKATPAAPWEPANGTAANPVQGFDLNLVVQATTTVDGGVFDVGELTSTSGGGAPSSATLSMPRGATGLTTTGVRLSADSLAVSSFGDQGLLTVTGNSSLTGGASLTLSGVGTGSLPPGPMENDGTMTVSASTLVAGALTGHGVMGATNGSKLSLGTTGTGETIRLASAHLTIGGQLGETTPGMQFLAPITDFGAGSSITLLHTKATSEVFVKRGPAAGELFLYNGAAMVADLQISGQAHIYATYDPQSGNGGSVTLTATGSALSLPTVGSANDTVVAVNRSGPSGTIADASGNAWAITSGGRLTLDGVAVQQFPPVAELAYVNGVVWQENAGGAWNSIASRNGTVVTGLAPTQVPPVQGVNVSLLVGPQAGAAAPAATEAFTIGDLTASGPAIFRLPTGAATVTTTGVHLTGAQLEVEDFNGTGRLVIAGNSTLSASAALDVQEVGAGPLPAGPLENDGAMTVAGARLDAGSLSGRGVVTATGNSTLELGSASAGETIQLQSANLYIGGGIGGGTNPGLRFLAPITDFGAGSSIVLFGTDATREVFASTGPTAGDLLLYNGSALVANLHVSGQAHIYAAYDPLPAFGPFGSVTLTATDNGHSLPIASH